jgi:uncharacterized protein (DUF302 family)
VYYLKTFNYNKKKGNTMIKLITTLVIATLTFSTHAKEETLDFAQHGFAIEQTVYKVPVSEGVTAEDVHMTILSRGNELNMKFVGHQPLSKELDARGVVGGQVDIYQFCNPMDARKMIDFNPVFVAYMPCRIAMVEDAEGKLWLMMLDLDMLINNTPLTPEISAMANTISDKLKQIIESAREGDF